MSIRVYTLSQEYGYKSTVIVCDSAISNERLKQVIAKGLNTWDQAHPELKELYDVLEHGRILQDYYSQGFTGRTKD